MAQAIVTQSVVDNLMNKMSTLNIDDDVKIDVVSWQPIAFWKFKTTNPECQICKEHYETPCTTCLYENTTKGQIECNPSKGKCGHCFHKHCIDKWLSNKKLSCPICSTPYESDINNMDAVENWKKIITSQNKNTTKINTVD